MYKLFLGEAEGRSETLELLAKYLAPVLRLKLQSVILTKKEQALLQLKVLPALVYEDVLLSDYEKLIGRICELAGVEGLLCKEAEVWQLMATLTKAPEKQGKELLDLLNPILMSKTFLATPHITIVDIVAVLPSIRALQAQPLEKQLEWMNVYRWAEHLLNLPHLGNLLSAKGLNLVPLAVAAVGQKPLEVPKPSSIAKEAVVSPPPKASEDDKHPDPDKSKDKDKDKAKTKTKTKTKGNKKRKRKGQKERRCRRARKSKERSM
jgi:hypothetical protein